MALLAVLTARPDLPVHRDLEAAGARSGHVVATLDAVRAVAVAAPARVLLDGAAFLPQAVLARVGAWRSASTLAVLEALERSGVPALNPAAAVRLGRDHWATACCLAAAGLPHPETVAGAEPETLAAAAAEVCAFPCVVKQRTSRRGVGVIRCDGRAELEAVLDALWRLGDEVVVQRFCPPGGIGRRVLVVASRALGATEHQAAAGEFRANAARGAAVRAIELPPGLGELAVAAAAALGLSFAGVDLIPDGRRWVVGEVNPSPGWTHFAAATGIPVADRVVEALAGLAAAGGAQ